MGITTFPDYIKVEPGTALPVNDTVDYWLELVQGNLPGKSVVHKFGRNDAVPNGTWEGILQLSTDFVWLTAATTVQVKAGGSGGDTAAGAGAQAVTVEGLDETGAFATEDIELAGSSASNATATTFIRVFRMYIADGRVGKYGGRNTAAIILENSASSADLITISADEGQSQYCAYTIPLGKTGYLMSAIVQADASKAADFRLFTRKNILDTSTPFEPSRLKFYWDGVIGDSIIKSITPLQVLPALTDIWIEARGGGAGTEVSGDMEIVLIDD